MRIINAMYTALLVGCASDSDDSDRSLGVVEDATVSPEAAPPVEVGEGGVDVFQGGSTYELLAAELAEAGLRRCDGELALSIPGTTFCSP